MKTKYNLILHTIIGLFLTTNIIQGQCLMTPIDIGDQIRASEVVLEGEVVGRQCFSNAAENIIYTAYEIKVYKVFKGSIQTDRVELIEKGGNLNGKIMQVTPSVELSVGTVATFMLSELRANVRSAINRRSIPAFSAYANAQSVFQYDDISDEVSGVFTKTLDREEGWYPLISSQSGQTYIEKHKWTKKPEPSIRSLAPNISSMSPLTITAGTFSELVISGSGFGSTRGTSTVSFRDADNGPGSWYTPPVQHYVSWSATSITIMVPSRAGSGQVRVTVGGVTDVSPQSLTVPYNEFTFVSGGTLAQFQHCSRNAGNGIPGYAFLYHTDFNSNAAAKASFERALKSWQCDARVGFYAVGATTSVDSVGNDGINVVRFDNGSELASGVLGQATVFLTCFAPSLKAGPAIDIDVVFNDGTNWEYGPALPSGTEIDFESVALHELGHATLLGHVIDAAKVMHYSTDFGLHNRTLGTSDIDAATDVYIRSTTNPFYCSYAPISYFNPAATAVCTSNYTVTLINEVGSLTAADIDFASSSHCGYTRSINQTSFTCSDVGSVPVTLTITDQGAGMQTSQCTTFVTVREDELPIASCKKTLIQLDSTYTYTLTGIDDIDNGSTDNCGIHTRTFTPAPVDSSHLGIITAFQYIKDKSNNEANCSAQLRVLPYTKVMYVDKNTAGVGRGDSWANALGNLQNAFDAVEFGHVDTIKIAQGTYYPDKGFLPMADLRDQPFKFSGSVVVIGGYPTGGAVEPNAEDYPTILSGEIQNDGNLTNNAFTVLECDASNNGSQLHNLIIEAGYANGSASITNLRTGAGMFNTGDISMYNCIFRNNHAVGSNAGVGGGIITYTGDLVLSNCLFYENNAEYGGGAVSSQTGTLTSYNCTFADNNSSVLNGGAIHSYVADNEVFNSIFYNNTSGTVGEADLSDDDATNTTTVNQCLFNGSLPAGPNIVYVGANLSSMDPDLVDPAGDDYRITYISPALNAGNNTNINGSTDLAGNNRLLATNVDLGAYEFNYVFPCGEYSTLDVENPIFMGEYKASMMITSSAQIDNAAMGPVIFNSAGSVELLAEFEVASGEVFEAIIEDPCVD